jgi:lysophospholipase L1-like esterase
MNGLGFHLGRVVGLLALATTLSVGPARAADFRVEDFGARADGVATNTAAIQAAIDAAAAVGGGRVVLGPGLYWSGALFLKSNVRLHFEPGAELRAIQDDALYPDRPTRVAGIEMPWPSALVNVYQQTNVTITGRGVIDGNGEYWWRKFWGTDGKGGMLRDYRARDLRWAVDYDCKRVRALAVFDARDITIRDVTIHRSGFWSLTVTYSERVTVDGVTIRANIGGFGPSSDGIDIDSSRDVLVQNCDIDCNDDNICLKAGRDWDGLRVNRPTENVIIRDCVTRAGHGMLTIGSETSGGIRNVEVSGLKAYGTHNGIRFKSARVRGGVVENIVLRDIEMAGVANPIHMELNWYPSYSYPTLPADVDPATMPPHWTTLTRRVEPPERGIPEFRNIVISNLTAHGARQAIYANAYPEKPLRDVRLERVRIEAAQAGSLANVADWTMRDVVLATGDGKELRLVNAVRVERPEIRLAEVKEKDADPAPGARSDAVMLGLGGANGDGEPVRRTPRLFLIGDSTVRNGSGQGEGGLYGWGQFLGDFFPAGLRVENRALGGRSSRTFLTEGRWSQVLAELQPGDFVLIQFGHNDGGPLDEGRARASLHGTGPETRVITNQTSGVTETVRTYGAYLRQYVTEARARGATPILLSPVPRNRWENGRVLRADADYGKWAAAVARETGVPFIDLNEIVAADYERLGAARVAEEFFPPTDHTHTTRAGAQRTALLVAQALRALPDCPLAALIVLPQ